MVYKQEKSVYLVGLNGLRAIAALSVLIGHVFGPFGDWGLDAPCLPIPQEGVTTFFVISGFLITYLLLLEMKQTADVSVCKFYMRRILRIWPLYFVYILFSVVAIILLHGGIDDTIWYYVLFSGNISHALGIGLIPLFHYWSLGVEEQYYLWYPWVVKLSKQRILMMVVVLCCVWFGLKMGSYIFLGKGLVYNMMHITRFDCILIGAIGAILYHQQSKWFFQFCRNRWVGIISWILFFTTGIYAIYIPSPIRTECIAFVSLMVIMVGLLNKPILENKIINYLGKISYGIYVIHPLLIYLGSYFVKQRGLFSDSPWWGYVLIMIGVLGLTILLASVSYKYLEQPFLSLKQKYGVVSSTNDSE